MAPAGTLSNERKRQIIKRNIYDREHKEKMTIYTKQVRPNEKSDRLDSLDNSTNKKQAEKKENKRQARYDNGNCQKMIGRG
jgi:hypothetical protein